MYAINEEIKFAMELQMAAYRYEQYWRVDIKTSLPEAKWVKVERWG